MPGISLSIRVLMLWVRKGPIGWHHLIGEVCPGRPQRLFPCGIRLRVTRLEVVGRIEGDVRDQKLPLAKDIEDFTTFANRSSDYPMTMDNNPTERLPDTFTR